MARTAKNVPVAVIVVMASVTALTAFDGVMAATPSNGFLGQPMMADATIAGRASGGPGLGGLDGFTPAPIPDIDRNAPVASPVDPGAARVSPKLFHKQSTYQGEGYVFGSTVQEEQDRRVGPAPGINLIMPLQ